MPGIVFITFVHMIKSRITTLIQSLRENDPNLTDLDFRNVDGSRSVEFETGSSLFQELIGALETNHTVQKVNIVLRFLHKLSFEEQTQIFHTIGNLPNLEHLRVASSGLAGRALRLINTAIFNCANHSLKSLTLHSVHFKDEVRFQSEQIINTEDFEFVGFLDALTKLRKLQNLALEDVEDTWDLNSVIHAIYSIPFLRHLLIKSHTIALTPRLSEVSLWKLFSSDGSLRSLTLNRLFLAPLLPEFLVKLEDNMTLTNLVLEQNGLEQTCGMALAYLLLTNRTLKELRVGYNSIPDDCGMAIAKYVSNNTCIELLDMTANDLGVPSCQSFQLMMQANTSSLEHLNLSNNALTAEGGTTLLSALMENNTIKSLNLAETQMFGPAPFTVLGPVLSINTTLERLNLAENKIEDHMCDAIASSLQENSTLKAINLFGNRIGDTGAIKLAQCLQKDNSTLEQLNLASNHKLGNPSYKAMEKMLESNYTLQHLWLPTIPPNSAIPLYIKLNKVGRKRLLQEMDNAQLWMDAMGNCIDDFHCLHWFIRTNPTLVSWLNCDQ